MGKTVGSVRTGTVVNSETGRSIKVSNVRNLSEIESIVIRDEIRRAKTMFENEFGINTNQIYIATFNGAFGFYNSRSNHIYLNDKYFDKDVKKVEFEKRKEYALGQKVWTKYPVRHTIIHELAHRKWNSNRFGNLNFQFGLAKLYKEYRKEFARNRSVLGNYANSNIDEFFAEAVTGYLIGKSQNKYTKGVRELIRQYL